MNAFLQHFRKPSECGNDNDNARLPVSQLYHNVNIHRLSHGLILHQFTVHHTTWFPGFVSGRQKAELNPNLKEHR